MFELLRKFSLLMVLFIVGMGSYLTSQNSTDWREPLWVKLYPINADGRDATISYINKIKEKDFLVIEDFVRDEAKRYGVKIDQPVKIILGEQITKLPPVLPDQPGLLSIMQWSLKLRWWAHEVTSEQAGPQPDIRMFLIYHDPVKSPALMHSIGQKEGLIGVVNVFATRSQNQTNNFIIAHEMLHTLGATDKYDYANNMPLFPDGFADPEKQPLYPQSNAELMGGRIPLTATTAEIPYSLRQVIVGPATAEEIRWLK